MILPVQTRSNFGVCVQFLKRPYLGKILSHEFVFPERITVE